jgi:uncharacterized protein YndB with AHSA1/START domain
LSERAAITSIAERVIDSDPTRVWALVADPARLGEWAGVGIVGYMGTELPKKGQHVFVKGKLGPFSGRQHKVEIESWQAGSAVSCVVAAAGEPTRFDLMISPRVEPEHIATRVRLEQRSEVTSWLGPLAHWWMELRLRRMLNRIERTVSR